MNFDAKLERSLREMIFFLIILFIIKTTAIEYLFYRSQVVVC